MLSKSLEIARGLSALWVFLYHMRFNLDPGLFRRFADCGLLGVPAFFVISGYCMMASSRGTIAKGHSAGSFLRRRLRRIFPPFWASIAVCLAAPFFGAAIYWYRGGGLHFPSPPWYKLSPSDWLGLVTLTKGLAATGATHKPWAPVNSVYWSLAIEVQFYLVMALALLWRRGFMAVLAIATIGGVWWWRRGPFLSGLFMQYWAMFAFGLLLYTVLDRGFRPARFFGRWTSPASVALTAALIAATLGFTVSYPSETLERQTLFALCCGVILWAASGVEPLVRKDLLPTRAMTGLGKMSYSVYLIHVPLVSLVTATVRAFLPHPGTFSSLLCIAGTLPVAYLFYRYFEKPYATSRREPAPRRPEPLPEPQAVALSS
ncbi:MAG: acyltransferase [Bryobacteraceae bacterium]|jgi:peptidoglycan/LPS O-acetylase OafA/YrhL